MADTADDEVQHVAAEIVEYLRAHREAADTLAGAAKWWLQHQADSATVDRAMTLLVHRGLVERQTLPEGTIVFRGGPKLVARTDTRSE